MQIKSFFSILLLAVIILTSCKKELEPQDSSPVSETAPNANPAAAPNGQNPNGQMQMQPNMTTVTTPAPVVTAPGMNPPHGQPNHRCDISVGAPLNSPVAKPAAAPQQNQVITQVTPSSTPSATITPATVNTDGSITPAPTSNTTPAILQAPVETAPGMNPPHGQEGHVCGVAVGAPLPK